MSSYLFKNKVAYKLFPYKSCICMNKIWHEMTINRLIKLNYLT